MSYIFNSTIYQKILMYISEVLFIFYITTPDFWLFKYSLVTKYWDDFNLFFK